MTQDGLAKWLPIGALVAMTGLLGYTTYKEPLIQNVLWLLVCAVGLVFLVFHMRAKDIEDDEVDQQPDGAEPESMGESTEQD